MLIKIFQLINRGGGGGGITNFASVLHASSLNNSYVYQCCREELAWESFLA